MKARAAAALVLAVVTAFSGTARGGAETLLRVRIETADPSALRRGLESAGYDVLADAPPDSTTVEVVVSGAELQQLRDSGLNVVAIEAGRPFGEVARDQATLAIVPGSYLNLDGVIARLYEIASANPGIARVVDITATFDAPPTFEGRHLFALKISDNVTVDEDEPAILIVSGHHAREIVTPVIALDAAERLTAGYGRDPRITATVNDHEIWIAPVWNPDGYHYVFTVDNFWRKNRRVFVDGVGVDQNRNYPQGWEAPPCAGSTVTTSATYKGPSPASEAETQTMMTWSKSQRFAKVLDYHSTGREVLYSYQCLGHPFTSWMQAEAVAISRASGYGGATRLPSAEGEHQEWQFARMGAYAFLIETHTQFQPLYNSALSEAAMVWPGILSVLERPISVSGHVTDAVTGRGLEADIELLNVAFANGETNTSGGPYGRYHMFLPPGTYDVRFSKAGYESQVRTVSVTATSATIMDIQLALPPPPPDTTPPARSGGQPTGTLPAGTTETTLALTTSEPATCRYSQSPGVSYETMPQTFVSTGGTAHATPVLGLVDGGSYAFYVRCLDAAGNANPDDFAITFSVSTPPPPDTTAPVLSGGQPTGALPAGTAETTLALSTSEPATCRYSTSAGVPYDAMSQTFVTTGGTAHATPLSGLVDGGSYTFYVRCLDAAGNANPDDFAIAFSVSTPPVVSVFSDDFETDRGWMRNPNRTDTANTGLWERGDPQPTFLNGPKQLGTTPSGVSALVTGRLAGSSAGSNDIDNGVTSIRSPAITLPTTGDLTLSFSYYFAHTSNSSSADFLRVRIVGGTATTVFEQRGAARDRDAVWTTAAVSLDAFAGQTIWILIEAADAGRSSLVEAAIDDVEVIARR